MGLWGASTKDEKKPVWLTEEQKKNCFADERGWVIKRDDGREEVLVAIGGLNKLLDALDITRIEFVQKSLSGGSNEKLDVDIWFNEEVVVEGTPTLTVSSTSEEHFDLDYNAAKSDVGGHRIRFSGTGLTFVGGDTLFVGGYAGVLSVTVSSDEEKGSGYNGRSLNENDNGETIPVKFDEPSEGVTAEGRVKIAAAGVGGVVLGAAGGGFTSAPVVTINNGVGGATATATLTGTSIANEIEIVEAGSGYDSAPTITISDPPSGTTATATATVTDGAVTSIVVDDAGSGYTSAPTVTASQPGGANQTQATFKATLTPTSIASIAVNDAGSYTSPPSVTITPESNAEADIASAYSYLAATTVESVEVDVHGTGYSTPPDVFIGDEWEANKVIKSSFLYSQVYYGDNLYTITQTGTFGETAPTHTSNEVDNGTTKLTYAGKRAKPSVTREHAITFDANESIKDTDNSTPDVNAVLEKADRVEKEVVGL